MTKFVVRRGSLLKEEYLQPDGTWGHYKTSKRFSSQAAADLFHSRHVSGKNYGVFPVSRSDNPRRPPKQWMRDCVAGASESAADPGAVCGALWYRKMSPAAKRAALARERRDNPWARVFG